MIKTYKSNTNISINVVLQSKKNLHISFTPLSNGSSLFTTDSEEVQTAIERHYKFGTLFRLHAVQDQSVAKEHVGKAGKKSSTKPADETENAATDDAGTSEDNSESDAGTEARTKKVTVSDLASAKDYLADKLGISRTILRSKKAIEEQAAANGIEFEGLS